MNIEVVKKKIFANFDFAKVHKVMTALNWKWMLHRGNVVPTIDEIKEAAIRLVNIAIKEKEEKGADTKSVRISTGGFCASVYNSDNVTLEFVVESYDEKD